VIHFNALERRMDCGKNIDTVFLAFVQEKHVFDILVLKCVNAAACGGL
jgi:hypothetical protein